MPRIAYFHIRISFEEQQKKKNVSAIYYNVLDVFRRIILLFFCSRSLVFLRLFLCAFFDCYSFRRRYVSVSVVFFFHSGYTPTTLILLRMHTEATI